MEIFLEKLLIPLILSVVVFLLTKQKYKSDIQLTDAGSGKAIVERAVLSADKIDELTDKLIAVRESAGKLQIALEDCLLKPECREMRGKVKDFLGKIEHLFTEFDETLKAEYSEIQKLL